MKALGFRLSSVCVSKPLLQAQLKLSHFSPSNRKNTHDGLMNPQDGYSFCVSNEIAHHNNDES